MEKIHVHNNVSTANNQKEMEKKSKDENLDMRGNYFWL